MDTIRQAVAEVLRHDEAATPGPWVQWVEQPAVYAGPVTRNFPYNIGGFRGEGAVAECPVDSFLPEDTGDYDLDDEETVEGLGQDAACANAGAIAHYRTAAPALARAVERLATAIEDNIDPSDCEYEDGQRCDPGEEDACSKCSLRHALADAARLLEVQP